MDCAATQAASGVCPTPQSTHHLRQSQGHLQTPHPAPRQHNPRRSWTSEIRAKLAGTAMLKPQRDRRRACAIEVRCHLIVAKFCPSNPNGAKLNQKYEPTPDGLSVSAHGGLFAVLAPPSPRLVPALYCPLGALHLHRGVPWTVTSASKKPWTCTCARCASLSIRCAVVCDTPARGHVPVAELTVMTQCAVAATCMWLTCCPVCAGCWATVRDPILLWMVATPVTHHVATAPVPSSWYVLLWSVLPPCVRGSVLSSTLGLVAELVFVCARVRSVRMHRMHTLQPMTPPLRPTRMPFRPWTR